MAVGFKRSGFYLFQQPGKTHLPAKLAPKSQRVYKETDKAFYFLMAAPCTRGNPLYDPSVGF